MLECVTCRRVFIPRHEGNRFCSRACANRAPRQRTSTRQGRTCEVCGVEYAATYREQRTCGRWCGSFLHHGYWPQSSLTWRTCRCGATWHTKTTKPCSCSSEYVHVAGTERVKPCRHCAALILFTVKVGKDRATCDACRALSVARIEREAKRRRRARKRGAVVERFDSLEIFERDKWTCGICSRAVKRDAKVPHPKAPTIDHVVPISDGGDHTRANVRCAHFLCNSKRGNVGGGEQLALVG